MTVLNVGPIILVMCEKCFGPANCLKKPFGLGRGVPYHLYFDEKGNPIKIDCSMTIGTEWGVYCAAPRPTAIQEDANGKPGSLSGLRRCFKVHPRTV